jgi:C4-dicarboxylate-specific signal transduction histidine kinase
MRQDWETQISVMTRVIAKNIISSILFADQDSAQNTLESLDGESGIVSAILYNEKGEIFAKFEKDESHTINNIKMKSTERFDLNLKKEILTFYYPILREGKILGAIIVTTSTKQLYIFLAKFFILIAILFFAVLLLILILSSRMQRKLTGPIDLLLNFFEDIKINADYERRLPIREEAYNDINEFFKVGLSFNEMFEKVDAQNKIISKAKENLEELVDVRTKERDEEKVKLMQSGKMASLGEMASGIAHEINNPLAIIGTSALIIKKLISKGQLTDEKLNNIIETISTTVQRISAIITGLKNFSRDSSQEDMKPANVKAIVNETLQFCSKRFKNKNVELIINEFNDDLEIECNATQISQVVLNLFNNSYDAICDETKAWVELSVINEKNIIKIILSDCGTGIPLDIQDKILQPFFTTKEIGKGTGLGLSISVGIIEMHQGKFYIDTKAKHTTFVIEMPKNQIRERKELI